MHSRNFRLLSYSTPLVTHLLSLASPFPLVGLRYGATFLSIFPISTKGYLLLGYPLLPYPLKYSQLFLRKVWSILVINIKHFLQLILFMCSPASWNTQLIAVKLQHHLLSIRLQQNSIESESDSLIPYYCYSCKWQTRRFRCIAI